MYVQAHTSNEVGWWSGKVSSEEPKAKHQSGDYRIKMGSNSVCFGQQIRVSVPSSLAKSYLFHPAWNVSKQSLETRSRYSTR